MKDGRTHLAYKAEHVVDLDTDMVLAASIYRADHSDYDTATSTLDDANEHLAAVDEDFAIDEAVMRMQDANPHLAPEQALHLTVHGTHQNEDGTFTWKFDNYVRAFSPYLFNLREARDLWRNVTCPTLLVRGLESWAGDPVADGRIDHFQSARSVDIEKAGHWVHHDQLDVFLEHVRAFLAE